MQNPHGLPSASAISTTATAVVKKEQEKPKPPKAVSEVKTKAAVPCKPVPFPATGYSLNITLGNVSPYSSGAPGASLTSTSVDPQTQSSQLLWDEVCGAYGLLSAIANITLGRANV